MYFKIAGAEIRAIMPDASGLKIGQKVKFGVQQNAVHVLGKEAA